MIIEKAQKTVHCSTGSHLGFYHNSKKKKNSTLFNRESFWDFTTIVSHDQPLFFAPKAYTLVVDKAWLSYDRRRFRSRRQQIANSSVIVCDHMKTHFCDRLREEVKV